MFNATRYESLKTYCPACGGQGRITYTEYQACRLVQEDEAGNTDTQHFHGLRDYWCANCDHTWLMQEPEDCTDD